MIPFKNGCRITSPLGDRKDPHTGELTYHVGIDMVPIGDDAGVVISPFYGTVTKISDNRVQARGIYVVVMLSTKQVVVFQHLKQRSINVGAQVVPGTALGVYGDTGKSTAAHLHIEAWKTVEQFETYNTNTSIRDGLLPIYDLLGITNTNGAVFEQNYEFDIITDNPLFTTPETEPWTAAEDWTDGLRKPLSDAFGTGVNFDKTKYKDVAIVCGEQYIGGYADSCELKHGVKDTSTVVKLTYATEGPVPEVELGEYLKIYSDEVGRIIFYGRIAEIEKGTSKFTLTAKDRMYYLSKSDMTVQFTDGQNTGDAIRSLCNVVRISHNIPRFKTTISSSMIFYKDNFVSILKKLLSREEEFTGKEYCFYYDYEMAQLIVEEKGKESFAVSLSALREFTKTRTIENVRNVVAGYDSSAKTASTPIIDEESIEKYGALIHYYALSDDTVSGHISAYLEKYKTPLTSGSFSMEGTFWLRPGMTLRLPDVSPIVFLNERLLVVDSITHKIGESHEMQVAITEYKAVDVPSEETVETFKANSVLQSESERTRLTWLYFKNREDFIRHIKSYHESEIKQLRGFLGYLKNEETTVLQNKLCEFYSGRIYISDNNTGVYSKYPDNDMRLALLEAFGVAMINTNGD